MLRDACSSALDADERIADFWLRATHHESLHPHDAVAVATKSDASAAARSSSPIATRNGSRLSSKQFRVSIAQAAERVVPTRSTAHQLMVTGRISHRILR